MNPEKVFIDVDEEIIFTLEKLRNAASEEVILVVPEHALLLGSAVSLELLARETAVLKKIPVLVTNDEVGMRLGGRAGLALVNKVSDITSEVWDKAKALNEKILEELGKVKHELIKERQLGEIEKSSVNDIVKETKKEEPAVEKEKKEEKIEDIPKKEETDLSFLKPKIIEVEGYTIVSGGDICQFKELLRELEEKAERHDVESIKLQEEEIILEEESEKGKYDAKYIPDRSKNNTRNTLNTVSAGALALKDRISKVNWSRYANKLKGLSGVFDARGSYNKIIVRLLIVLVIFYIFSYIFLPTGKVTVFIESKTSTVSENISADTSVTNLDLDSLTIPAQYIEKNFDISDSGNTTEEAETGNRATGEIGVFNKTMQSITLVANTKFVDKVSGREYFSNFNVNIAAATDTGSGIDFGYADVGVTAASYGESYNTNGATLSFTVTGYTDAQVTARNFKDIKGGTTRKIKVVSQGDVSKMKAQLLEKVKSQALDGLKQVGGADTELVPSSLTTEVINETVIPDVGKESDTFNVSVTIKGKVLSFAKKDLDPLAAELITRNTGASLNVEKYEYDPKVTGVDNNKVNISLDITAVVRATIDVNDLKRQLKSKSLSEVEGVLRSQDDIKNFKIDIGPMWMPSFLKHMPGDEKKIDVRVEKA